LHLQALLKAIEKGDIVNSGVHQASKDGSVGKGNPDVMSLKLPKEVYKQFKFFIQELFIYFAVK
jgi:hypothetical protein